MACERVTLPNGASAIVCGPRRPHQRCRCGRRATLLCDWKMVEGTVHSSGTCSEPICDRCTASPAPNKDLCPAHAEAFTEWKAQRA